MGFHYAAALPSYRLEGCFQRCAGHTTPSMLLVRHKTGNSPKSSWARFELERLVAPVAVDPGKFLLWPVLAPTHGLPVRADQDPMRASLLNEFLFLPPIARSSLFPRAGPVAFGQRA
jgi:hypothetical protein